MSNAVSFLSGLLFICNATTMISPQKVFPCLYPTHKHLDFILNKIVFLDLLVAMVTHEISKLLYMQMDAKCCFEKRNICSHSF